MWSENVTGVLILDSGAVTKVAENRGKAVSLVRTLVERGWTVAIPVVVLVECLTGDSGRDANSNRFVRAVSNLLTSEEQDARLAASLRHRCGNPSVVDALVAAAARRTSGPCLILTTDPEDLERQASGAGNVRVIGC